VDATAVPLRVVRQGAISLARLREVVPGLVDVDGNAPSAPEPGTATPPPAESSAEPSAQSGEKSDAEPSAEPGAGTGAG